MEQAISYVKASQTGLWHKAPDGQELERFRAPRDPVYDAEAIRQHLTELVAMDDGWISWFAREGLTPRRIHYEDLSEDPKAVTGELLEHLGLGKELAIKLEIPVAKLADSTNRQWAIRFCGDYIS